MLSYQMQCSSDMEGLAKSFFSRWSSKEPVTTSESSIKIQLSENVQNIVEISKLPFSNLTLNLVSRETDKDIEPTEDFKTNLAAELDALKDQTGEDLVKSLDEFNSKIEGRLNEIKAHLHIQIKKMRQ